MTLYHNRAVSSSSRSHLQGLNAAFSEMTPHGPSVLSLACTAHRLDCLASAIDQFSRRRPKRSAIQPPASHLHENSGMAFLCDYPQLSLSRTGHSTAVLGNHWGSSLPCFSHGPPASAFLPLPLGPFCPSRPTGLCSGIDITCLLPSYSLLLRLRPAHSF